MGLNELDILDIHQLNTDLTKNILKIINELLLCDIDYLYQKIVDDIFYELDLAGGFLVLVEKDNAVLKSVTQNFLTNESLRLIYKFTKNIKINVNNKKNLVTKSIQTSRPIYSRHHSDFLIPIIPRILAVYIEKEFNIKSGIVFPLKNKIGAIYFAKDFLDDFSYEYNILEQYAYLVSEIIEFRTKDRN